MAGRESNRRTQAAMRIYGSLKFVLQGKLEPSSRWRSNSCWREGTTPVRSPSNECIAPPLQLGTEHLCGVLRLQFSRNPYKQSTGILKIKGSFVRECIRRRISLTVRISPFPGLNERCPIERMLPIFRSTQHPQLYLPQSLAPLPSGAPCNNGSSNPWSLRPTPTRDS
jgi:hypothetical protein